MNRPLVLVALAGAGGAVIYCLLVLGANEFVGPVVAYESNVLVRWGEIAWLLVSLSVLVVVMLRVGRHR